MKTHELKTWPKFYEAILNNTKPFEIRKNDRDFQVNDHVILREWEPSIRKYSGRSAQVVITYLTDFEQKPGFVVFGFSLLTAAVSLAVPAEAVCDFGADEMMTDEDWVEDELEEAMSDCGFMPEFGSCSKAGSEECDFECKLRPMIEAGVFDQDPQESSDDID